MDKIIIKPKSLNLKRRAITIGKILKEKEGSPRTVVEAQQRRKIKESLKAARSRKKTVFLRFFYDFKAAAS